MTSPLKYYRMPTGGPVVTQERAIAIDAAIVAVLDEGKSLKEASAQYGVVPGAIANHMANLRKRGVSLPKLLPGRRAHERDRALYEVNPATGKMALSRKTIDWLRELRAEGHTRAEISNIAGIGTGIVAKFTEPGGSEYRSSRADPTEAYGQPHA